MAFGSTNLDFVHTDTYIYTYTRTGLPESVKIYRAEVSALVSNQETKRRNTPITLSLKITHVATYYSGKPIA